MTRAIRLSVDAEGDLDRLDDFLAEKAPAAAVRSAVAIAAGVESLRDLSERGHKAGPGLLRELFVPFGRSAYVIQYTVDPGEVIVLRIFHSLEER